MNRKTARENAFILLFELASKADETAEEIFDKATNIRELEVDEFVKRVFFGVNENIVVIDKCIADSLVGWKATRLSTVSKSVTRLAVYELMFLEDIPDPMGHAAGSMDGAYSILVGVAANKSISEGKVVSIEELLRE